MIQPQSDLKDDRKTISVRTVSWMGVSNSGKRDDGGVITEGEDLRIPPPEHSHTVHCSQAHYGPVPGGRAAAGVKGGQAVVVTGRLGLGEELNGGSGRGNRQRWRRRRTGRRR